MCEKKRETCHACGVEERHIPSLLKLLNDFDPEITESVLRYSVFENPDLKRYADLIPPGVVLECDGKVCGFSALFPMEYFYKQQSICFVATGMTYVAPDYRDYSVDKYTFILDLPCAVVFSNSVNFRSSQLAAAMRYIPGPASCSCKRFAVPVFSEFILYIIRSKFPFLRFLPAFLSRVLFAPIDWWRESRRSRHVFTSGTERRELYTIDRMLFEEFNRALIAGNQGFIRSRRPEILKYLFEKRLFSKQDVLIGRFDRTGKLLGYIALRQGRARYAGHTMIMDWVALDNRLDILTDLLYDALEFARRHRCGMLSLFGYPDCVQQVIQTVFPGRRNLPNCNFYYKFLDTGLFRRCRDEMNDSWFFGPFDGDAVLSNFE